MKELHENLKPGEKLYCKKEFKDLGSYFNRGEYYTIRGVWFYIGLVDLKCSNGTIRTFQIDTDNRSNYIGEYFTILPLKELRKLKLNKIKKN